MAGARLKVLAITNLFPNNVDPAYAPFNRQQFAELGKLCDLDVFGVVPWRLGRWYGSGSSAGVVCKETIDGLQVAHPRFPSIPGVPSLNAALLASALLPRIAIGRTNKRWDLMLAAYAYPDGCAGVMLGELLRLPVVVKCHGSDLNRVPRDRPARMQLEALLPRAKEVVVVSKKLAERARELGVRDERINVVYNGVDRDRFQRGDKMDARRLLGLPADREIVLYVGHLAEHKGAGDLLQAAKKLGKERPNATVVFVGDGPLSKAVQDAGERGIDVPGGVVAVGRVTHAEVADFMTACDVLCLPSWDEGMPNVVREAHASGRPVVATSVGGIPEAVASQVLGVLVPPRDPDALAAALAKVLAGPFAAPEEIVRAAIVPTWKESAEELHRVLARAVR